MTVALRRLLPGSLAGALVLALSVGNAPAWAGDPFRSRNERPISDTTEAAFEAAFRAGDYPLAAQKLRAAEGDDPLLYALRAAMAYTERDWQGFQRNGRQTLERAQALRSQDPLRGELYTAVGHFLVGAYTYKQQDGFSLGLLNRFRQALQALDEAERIDPQDPEMNLVSGFIELLLAANFPWQSAQAPIESLKERAAPEYLAYRGVALGYRDTERYEQALQFAERALEKVPDNPELQHLKGQILYRMGRKRQDPAAIERAIASFEQALAQKDQVPASYVSQWEQERREAQQLLQARR